MAAPVGAVVRMGPYRWSGGDPPPGVGDYLATAAGSVYRILTVRPLRTPHHYALAAVVESRAGAIPPGVAVYEMAWDRRTRRR